MASNHAGKQESPAAQYPDQENPQPGGQGGLEHQHGDDERPNLQDGAGGRHEPLTALQQEQLDWLSRFADRLRLLEPRLAAEDQGTGLNELARQAWERLEWRRLGPEDAAAHWLDRRSLDGLD
jgi:hypothetical protein